MGGSSAAVSPSNIAGISAYCHDGVTPPSIYTLF
jgi:hypothetical protein